MKIQQQVLLGKRIWPEMKDGLIVGGFLCRHKHTIMMTQAHEFLGTAQRFGINEPLWSCAIAVYVWDVNWCSTNPIPVPNDFYYYFPSISRMDSHEVYGRRKHATWIFYKVVPAWKFYCVIYAWESQTKLYLTNFYNINKNCINFCDSSWNWFLWLASLPIRYGFVDEK